MNQQLVVISGPDRGRTFRLGKEDTLYLGRSRATETQLTDPCVSRVHCQIQVKDDQVEISDHESASGTYINGQRIDSHRLRPGDVIRIGTTELRYEREDPTLQSTVCSITATAIQAGASAEQTAADLPRQAEGAHGV